MQIRPAARPTAFLACALAALAVVCAACSGEARRDDRRIFIPRDAATERLLLDGRAAALAAREAYKAGNLPQTIASYQAALSNFLRIDNVVEACRVQHSIGLVQLRRGKYDEAAQFLGAAMEAARRAGLLREQAEALAGFGLLAETKRQYAVALTQYVNALYFFQALKDNYEDVAAQYNNVGYVQQVLGKHAEAITNFRRSAKINQALKNYGALAETHSHIGRSELVLGKAQAALLSFASALAADKAVENADGIASDLKNLGLAYEALGKHAEAADHFERAIRINYQLQLPLRVYKDLGNLVRAYERLGNAAKAAEYRQALAELRASLLRDGVKPPD